jgi:hypothetical protein
MSSAVVVVQTRFTGSNGPRLSVMLPDGASYVFFQSRLPMLLSAKLMVQTVYGVGVPLIDRTPGAMFGVVPNRISPGSTYYMVGLCVVAAPAGIVAFVGPIKSPMVMFHEYAVLVLTALPSGLHCR